MTTLFGQLGPTPTIFGTLDESLVAGFTQSNPVVFTLSDSGTHEFAAVYEHLLEADIQVYDAGTHEYVPAPGPGAYLHTASVRVQLLDVGTHEYVGAQQLYDHTQPNVVSLSDLGAHSFSPGGGFIHDERSAVVLSDNGTHSYTESDLGVTGSFSVEVGAWLRSPAQANFDASATVNSISRVVFDLQSTDDAWLTDTGPLGGRVAASIEIQTAGGAIIPVASVSAANNRAVLFEVTVGDPRFEAIRAALLAGPVTLLVGGYEYFDEYSLPLDLSDNESTFRAVVQQ